MDSTIPPEALFLTQATYPRARILPLIPVIPANSQPPGMRVAAPSMVHDLPSSVLCSKAVRQTSGAVPLDVLEDMITRWVEERQRA